MKVLDFDESHDDHMLQMLNKKADPPQAVKIEEEGTFSEDGRVFQNLDHIKFEQMANLVNGVKLLALKDANDLVDERDLFKMRIADPVCFFEILAG